MSDINYENLTETELNEYVGRVTINHIQTRIAYEKAKAEYSALNIFLEKHVKNKSLKLIENKKELNKIFESILNDSGENCDLSITKENETFDSNFSLCLDKQARIGMTEKLCSKGEVGILRRYEAPINGKISETVESEYLKHDKEIRAVATNKLHNGDRIGVLKRAEVNNIKPCRFPDILQNK